MEVSAYFIVTSGLHNLQFFSELMTTQLRISHGATVRCCRSRDLISVSRPSRDRLETVSRPFFVVSVLVCSHQSLDLRREGEVSVLGGLTSVSGGLTSVSGGLTSVSDAKVSGFTPGTRRDHNKYVDVSSIVVIQPPKHHNAPIVSPSNTKLIA